MKGKNRSRHTTTAAAPRYTPTQSLHLTFSPRFSHVFGAFFSRFRRGTTPQTHGEMFGYALDGFGIYAFGVSSQLVSPQLDTCLSAVHKQSAVACDV